MTIPTIPDWLVLTAFIAFYTIILGFICLLIYTLIKD